MFSVTQRIKMVSSSFLSPNLFQEAQIFDGFEVKEVISALRPIQGLAVDYLTRCTLGVPKEKAFAISLRGADYVSEETEAILLLNNIKGLDDLSIKYACKLVQYDVAIRRGPKYFSGVSEELFDNDLFNNIRCMVQRSSSFLNENGPVVMEGFSFEGGYNKIISKGDGDFLTKDTLWDFKVSTNKITSSQILQVAVYYVLGIHSIHPLFKELKYLGIYNPFLNVSYKAKITDISNSIFADICRHVIGYNTSENPLKWKESYGTNLLMYQEIRQGLLKDTGFRPQDYKDGIYDITIDDYWSYYRTIADTNYRPKFQWTTAIKFLKNQGFYMFISISEKGKLCALKGGSYKGLKKPLQYYYERMPEYGNLILQIFSGYWSELNRISKQIQTIKPERSLVKKRQYGEYKRNCKLFRLLPEPFDIWYQHEKDNIMFVGKVHGCIIDFDATNHIFLNPSNGKIVPYSAPSINEKYVYSNIVSLISSKRPEMLEGYKELCDTSTDPVQMQSGNSNESFALITVDNSLVKAITQKGDSPIDKETISNETVLITETEMYRVSNRIKELQNIYDHGLIVAWYDNILPHYELSDGMVIKTKNTFFAKKAIDFDWKNMKYFLNAKDLSKMLDIGEQVAKEWLRSGEIETVKVGRCWCVEKGDLRAYLEKE